MRVRAPVGEFLRRSSLDRRRCNWKAVMTIDRLVMRFAGTIVLLGLLLGLVVDPWWLALVALVGLNLLQASFTGFCPLAILLKKLGVKPGQAFG